MLFRSKIEVTEDRITFSFLPAHRVLREQFEQAREWLEPAAQRLAGRRVSVVAAQTPAASASVDASTTAGANASAKPASGPAPPASRDLKAEALSSSAVQAMLDVFPAEIRDVEEM